MEALDGWISEKNVLVCVGSGGVGKTTLSAAIALSAARRGKKVLALTVDPSKRLAYQLGLDPERPDVQEVSRDLGGGNLFACVIHPKWIFDRFVAQHAQNAEMAERLLENKLYQQLSTTLSGSQEFTSLELLYSEHQSGKYDLIVLDTPPAQHAVDFLEAPGRLRALFDESVLKWFKSDGSFEGGRWYNKVFQMGTLKVLSSMEILTGKTFIQNLIDFFKNLSGVQSAVAERGQKYENLLKSEDTGFIMVSGFDETKFKEAQDLRQQLDGLGMEMVGVVVNRVFPYWWGHGRTDHMKFENKKLSEEFERYFALFEERVSHFESFSNSFSQSAPVLAIPDRFLGEDRFLDLDELMASSLWEGTS